MPSKKKNKTKQNKTALPSGYIKSKVTKSCSFQKGKMTNIKLSGLHWHENA